MTKRGMKWAAAVVSVLVGVSAWAGAKATYSVSLSFGSSGGGLAAGPLGSVRNSASTVEHIGCMVAATGASSGGTEFGYCSASDTNGTFVSCYTQDPKLVNAMRAIKGDSKLQFDWNAAGDCTAVVVEESSSFAPKGP